MTAASPRSEEDDEATRGEDAVEDSQKTLVYEENVDEESLIPVEDAPDWESLWVAIGKVDVDDVVDGECGSGVDCTSFQ